MKRFLQIIDKIYAAVCTARCPRGVNCKMYVPAQKHFRDSPTGDSHAGKRKRTCVYAKCRLRAIMRANHLDRKFRKIGRQRGGAERTLIPLSSTKRTDCCRENGAAFSSIKRQHIRTELYYNNNVRC